MSGQIKSGLDKLAENATPNKKKKIFGPGAPRLLHSSRRASDHKTANSGQLPSWSSLPAAVLPHIYKNLIDLDRASMARVCQSWSQGFHDPVLWRSKVVEFGRWAFMKTIKLKFTSGQNAVKFTTRFRRCLKEVAIVISEMNPQNSDEIYNDFLQFSSRLDDARLRSLKCYGHYLRFVNDERRESFYNAFSRLISGQTFLKKFRTDDFYFELESGLRFLKCLADAAGATVEILVLKSYFQNPMLVYPEERVFTEMQVIRLLQSVACYHATIKELNLVIFGEFPALDTLSVQNILLNCRNL